MSSPGPNDWGGCRTEDIRPATSVPAGDIATGEVRWSRRPLRHDTRDQDAPSASVLVDIDRGGQRIPALVQATGQGFLFVLDRRTGEPVFPAEARPVPASVAEGEVAASPGLRGAAPAHRVRLGPARQSGAWLTS